MNNSGGAGGNPRTCSICRQELNLFTMGSLQWVLPTDTNGNGMEIDFLCPTCMLLMRSQFNNFRSQFEEE